MPHSKDSSRVYVIDDEESVRKGFSLLLRSAGMVCQAFPSAEEFLAEVDPQQQEGCVLLDITMPRLSGFEFQKELQRRKFILPVIAISARDDAETALLARQLGARFFFRKPVDDQALLDAIHWILGSRRPWPASRSDPGHEG
ncbi:MAG: response regulator transcription factor [Verrucomicrobiia bacterium]